MVVVPQQPNRKLWGVFEQGKRKKILSKVCIDFQAMRTWLEAASFRYHLSQ